MQAELLKTASSEHTQGIGQTVSAFTFYVADSLYGAELDSILSVTDNLDKIQNIPVKGNGISGVYKYQETVVPIFDLASLLGVESGQQVMQDLIENLEAREKDHIDWINELEKSIVENIPFTKATDPNQCAFGKWYNSFETRDETLKEILARFDSPHRHIHSLAEKLLALRDKGQQQEALDMLVIEKHTTLRRLKSLFHQAKEQIRSIMRPVIIFTTRDGVVPTLGIIADEVSDVIEYKQDDVQTNIGINDKTTGQNIISGMYVSENAPDSIICNVDNIIPN